MNQDTTGRITGHLKKSDILSHLPEEDLKVLARFSALVDFRRGEVVFEKGSKSKHMFIIDRGEVAIASTMETGQRGRPQDEGRASCSSGNTLQATGAISGGVINA